MKHNKNLLNNLILNQKLIIKDPKFQAKKYFTINYLLKVPIGGKNIPSGMISEYDPNYEENKKNLDA